MQEEQAIETEYAQSGTRTGTGRVRNEKTKETENTR